MPEGRHWGCKERGEEKSFLSKRKKKNTCGFQKKKGVQNRKVLEIGEGKMEKKGVSQEGECQGGSSKEKKKIKDPLGNAGNSQGDVG